MTEFNFKAKLFAIIDNTHHYVTDDNVKIAIEIYDNMPDLMEAECLKRRKSKSQQKES